MQRKCEMEATGSQAPQDKTGLPGSYLDRWPRRHFSGRSAPHRMCLRSVAWGWCSSDSSSASHARTQHCRTTRWSTWTSRRWLSDQRRRGWGGWRGEGGRRLEVGGRGDEGTEQPGLPDMHHGVKVCCARIIVTVLLHLLVQYCKVDTCKSKSSGGTGAASCVHLQPNWPGQKLCLNLGLVGCCDTTNLQMQHQKDVVLNWDKAEVAAKRLLELFYYLSKFNQGNYTKPSK